MAANFRSDEQASVNATPLKTKPLTSFVISLRLSPQIAAAVKGHAAHCKVSPRKLLNWHLRNSFANCDLLQKYSDCFQLDSKLDVRLCVDTLDQLTTACRRLGIQRSVYIRKLLYHFYMTRRLHYIQVDGH